MSECIFKFLINLLNIGNDFIVKYDVFQAI